MVAGLCKIQLGNCCWQMCFANTLFWAAFSFFTTPVFVDRSSERGVQSEAHIVCAAAGQWLVLMCKDLSRGFQKLANDLPRRVKRCLCMRGRSERVVLFNMVPPWLTEEVNTGPLLPPPLFYIFFLPVCSTSLGYPRHEGKL